MHLRDTDLEMCKQNIVIGKNSSFYMASYNIYYDPISKEGSKCSPRGPPREIFSLCFVLYVFFNEKIFLCDVLFMCQF